MNQFLAAGAALAIAFVLWGIGKSPKELFKTQSQKNFLRTTSTLVEAKRNLPMQGFEELLLNEIDWKSPQNPRERILLRKQLFKQITEGPESRLSAVTIASKWGDQSIISILKRGLRDSDSRVVLISAKGIAKFRAKST